MNDRDITGATAIAKALGVSRDTVLRMIRKGELPARKLRDNTSPWRVSSAEIKRLRGEK